MVKKPGRSKKARALRKRAETQLKVTRRDIEAMSVKDVQQLAHELQVHQIELEMQNEELRRTQAELEATRDRYRYLYYDCALIGQLMLDGKGMILDANLPACTLLGITPKNLMGQPIVRFLAEKSQSAVLCHLRKLFNTGVQQVCEVDLARQADVPVSVRFESIVVRDKRGQHAHVLSTLQDITERKQAEAVLRFSQEKLQQALQASNTGLWDWNTETNEVLLSREWKRQLGYKEAEVTDTFESWEARLHPDDHDRAVAFVRAYLATPVGDYQQEFRLRHKDGIYRWIEARASFVTEPDGRRLRLLGSHTDITEHKRVEESLAASKKQLRDILDSLFGFVVLYTLDGRIVEINRASLELGGVAKEDVLDRYFSETPWWSGLPDMQSRLRDCMNRAAHGECVRGELVFRVPGDHMATAEAIFGPLRDAAGAIINVLGFGVEITERKRAEEALRSREFGLKEAQRLARIGSWELDLQTSNLTWSDEIYRIFEIDPAAFQASYEGFLNLVHPDDREMVNRAYSDSVASEVPYDITHRLLMKDGRIKFVQERCQTDYLPDGTPNRSIGTIQDITERKQTEDALQFLSTGLIHLHDEAFFSKMADHAAKLLGLEIGFVGKLLPTKPPRIRAIGLSIDGQALSPVEYDLAKTPCERVISKQTAIFPEQVQQLFPDDRMFVELGVSSYAAIPLCDRNGCVIGHVGVMSRRPLRQVKLVENLLQLFAVRAAAELERQRTETMFHDLFEFSSDAIVMVNQAGLITLANRQAESLFGYSQAEFLGLPVETLMPESGRQGHVHMRQRFFSSATPRMMGLGASELCALKKDGTIFPVDISLSPIQTEDGLLVAASVSDITKRKQLDDQLALHAEELERLVIDRTAKIAKLEAQRAQAEKLVALGRLAAGIAHEINNPIAGIKNAFLIVKDAIPPDFAYYDFVGMIDREIDRVAGIIGLMYQLHSSEPPRKQIVDVAVLLRDLTALVAPQLNQHQISIMIEPSPALPQLMVSQRDLLQVLLNLVRNAIDASLEFGEINVSFKTNSTHVFISVKDQGSGIDPHVLPRIFEPFFSTKNTGVDKNMGLGLSVSHSLVCAMGGSIDVQSQVGAGSTVTIVLPIPADCVTSNGAMPYL